MKVLKVGNQRMFDIFTGEGWEKWTRVQVVKDAKEGFLSLRYVKGRHLPASFVKQAASVIIPQKKLILDKQSSSCEGFISRAPIF
jgi:hypothetical protein